MYIFAAPTNQRFSCVTIRLRCPHKHTHHFQIRVLSCRFVTQEVIDDALFSLHLLVTDDASIEDFVCLGGLQACMFFNRVHNYNCMQSFRCNQSSRRVRPQVCTFMNKFTYACSCIHPHRVGRCVQICWCSRNNRHV